MNCLIYLRVSTKEQAEGGYSLPAQREACLKFIKDKGWNFVDEYSDKGESARSAHRPQLQEMLSRIKKDDSINIVLVHKLDRLARNVADHVAIKAVLQKHKVSLTSVVENIEDSASGKLIENIMASLAEFYSANLSTEVKKGLLQKVKQGGWNGQAPVGYMNIKNEKGEALIVPDPKMAPLVQEAFNRYSTGESSITELYELMAKKGIKSKQSKRVISRSKFAKIFSNKAYMGMIVYQGIEYQGIHKPLVSKALFQRTSEVLSTHNHAGERKRKHLHYLKGSLYCGHCGARVSFTIAKGQYGYFYCLGKKTNKSCSQIYVPAVTIENLVEKLYKDIALPKELVSDLTLRFEDELKQREASNFSQREFMIKRLKKLNNEREKLLNAYYLDAIPVELLKKEQARITVDVNNLEAELSRASVNLDQINQIVEIAINMASNCYFAYQKASKKSKRMLNQVFFKKIYIKDDKVSGFERTDLFEFLYSFNSSNGSNKELLAEGGGFEPPNPCRLTVFKTAAFGRSAIPPAQ